MRLMRPNQTRLDRVRHRAAAIYDVGRAANSNRLLPMEGIRGFAVTLVFFVHYHALFSPYLGLGSWTLAISRFLENIGCALPCLVEIQHLENGRESEFLVDVIADD